jgi:methylmalonyl-CoA mutase cobalamin-binding domain/chain
MWGRPSMTDNHNTVTPTRFGFLLMPNYSMIAFTSAIEPLRMANLVVEQPLYEWVIMTLDGSTACASNGLRIEPDCAVADATGLDGVFVCAGVKVDRTYSKGLAAWLRKMAQRKIAIGALCTGTYLLARAGLLDGYQCTIHWENIASLREQFPNLIISAELFKIDRDRYTCSGGNSSLDMMLHLISQQHGEDLVIAISEQFMCDRIRGMHDRQRIPLRVYLGTSQPKLEEAVTIMEANIEEPISLDELAQHVKVSRRQLERLFQKYLHCVPTRYYLELRLKRARQLLLQSNLSIIDVGLACGFVSAPHFSKSYRDAFGIPPRDERRMHRQEIQEIAEAVSEASETPASVPEAQLAANTMKGGMEVLHPLQTETGGASPIGKVVIGTVKGDIHDIGKNLVATMLKDAGFEVVDIGIDVPVEQYLEALEEHKPDILGMSALLTTTMPYMKVVIDEMKEKGLRDDYIVLVGGAPLDEEFGQAVGADAYCRDAEVAVDIAKVKIAERRSAA